MRPHAQEVNKDEVLMRPAVESWTRTTRGCGCFADVTLLLAHGGIPLFGVVVFAAAAPPSLPLSRLAMISRACSPVLALENSNDEGCCGVLDLASSR
uniref:Uncharacterized protein n=1 Tax=Oryza meridionalis TaxID=40149 RepID=A0A0E0E047_9ORYZ